MHDDNARQLSIFDLDRTLTKRGTWSPFLLFAARQHAPWRLAFVPITIGLMAIYKMRLMSRKGLKEKMQALMLGQSISQMTLLGLAERFADRCMVDNFYAEGLAFVRSEQAYGRRVIIASAAPCFYLEVLARRMGVEHVGTKSVWRDGMLYAEIDGENCYGASKRDQIVEFMDKRGIDRSIVHVRFFSDDMSDLPTFEWADEAIAVNPSPRLARHAARQGWCIFNWRKSARAHGIFLVDDQTVKQNEIGLCGVSHAVLVGNIRC